MDHHIMEVLRCFAVSKTEKPCPVHEYAFVAPSDIIFTAEVRAACEANRCGRYGKCWTCPPGAGEWQTLREKYSVYPHAFVFTTRHELEDSFDLEGIENARVLHEKLNEAVLKLLAGENAAYELLGTGSCTLCSRCTYPDAPCRHPERARRSMEACGIDVVSLARDSGLHYMNGADTVTYFSVVFFN